MKNVGMGHGLTIRVQIMIKPCPGLVRLLCFAWVMEIISMIYNFGSNLQDFTKQNVKLLHSIYFAFSN